MRRALKVTANNICIMITTGDEQGTTISLMSTTEVEADTITVANPMRISCTGKQQPLMRAQCVYSVVVL